MCVFCIEWMFVCVVYIIFWFVYIYVFNMRVWPSVDFLMYGFVDMWIFSVCFCVCTGVSRCVL